MNIVFAGTPEFACPTLTTLAASGHSILAALTQPDRPAGRGRLIKPSATKQLAQSLNIPVLTPENGAAAEAAVRDLEPDVVIVVAYGLLLPKGLLMLPRHGCLNVHASLLPRWRGAAPIARAIEAGDKTSGVTIIRLDEGLDTGPMLAHRELLIAPGETTPQLAERLAHLGAAAMAEILLALQSGATLTASPQPASGASYARKLRKEEAVMDWGRSALALEQQVRAFTPWPGTVTTMNGTLIKVCEAFSTSEDSPGPGQVMETRGLLKIGTGAGALVLSTLQAPGGRPQPAANFLQGHPLRVGDHLD